MKHKQNTVWQILIPMSDVHFRLFEVNGFWLMLGFLKIEKYVKYKSDYDLNQIGSIVQDIGFD